MQLSKQLLHVGRLVLSLALLATGVVLAEERVFEKKLATHSGGTLTIKTDLGSIIVVGNDSKEVVVRATLRGQRSSLSKFDITADSTGQGVTVQGHRTTEAWADWSWLFGEGLRVNYSIQVPRDYGVTIRTAGGNVEIRNLNGKVVSKTSGGNVRLGSINGQTDAYTSGGNVHATALIGSTRLRTSGGNISLENAQGEVKARASGGNIHMSAIDGKLNAHTSGGHINAGLIGVNRGVKVNTSGGHVTLTVPLNFAASVNAHARGGHIDCKLPVTNNTGHKRGQLVGDLNGGGAALIARTSGGHIRIQAQH